MPSNIQPKKAAARTAKRRFLSGGFEVTAVIGVGTREMRVGVMGGAYLVD
jgi:hypothetical protein